MIEYKKLNWEGREIQTQRKLQVVGTISDYMIKDIKLMSAKGIGKLTPNELDEWIDKEMSDIKKVVKREAYCRIIGQL